MRQTAMVIISLTQQVENLLKQVGTVFSVLFKSIKPKEVEYEFLNLPYFVDFKRGFCSREDDREDVFKDEI
jgi:hypothetical protein